MNKKPLRLLILEDNPDDAELMVLELEKEGYIVAWEIVETEEDFKKSLQRPLDLILADYKLPSMNALDALEIVKKIAPLVPLVVISGTIGEEFAVECIKAGATDYVLKDKLFRLGPVVKRALKESKEYRKHMQVDIKLRKSYQKLQSTMQDIIRTIAKMVEIKDPYTAGHQYRVSQLATLIAKELKFTTESLEGIRVAALVHDIGKISIPAEILSKPSKLNQIEYSLIKDHCKIGYDILKNINFPWPVAKIILQHHERINGSGYPQGLTDDEILLEAKIMGVADVVEAMSSYRPYRPALGIDEALKEISQKKGIFYENEVVNICLKLFREKNFSFK